MDDCQMITICTDSGPWGKILAGLTSNVRDEDIIMHHIPVMKSQPGEPLKQTNHFFQVVSLVRRPMK